MWPSGIHSIDAISWPHGSAWAVLKGTWRQNINISHSWEIDSRSPTRLTFSTHSILINWPSYSSPAGLEGYKQRGGWLVCQPHFGFTEVKRVQHGTVTGEGAETRPRVVKGRSEEVELPHLHSGSWARFRPSAGQLIPGTNICLESFKVISTTCYQQEAGPLRRLR